MFYPHPVPLLPHRTLFGSRLCVPALIVWLIAILTPAQAQEFAAKMRVGLNRFASASELTLRAEPGARLLDGEGRECAAGGGPFVLIRNGSTVTAQDAQGRTLGTAASGTFWRLQGEEGATVLTISAAKGSRHRYRGELEVGAAGGRLHVVNEVSLEDYVRGVIGPEMGSRAPLEALKAQAVASRTFALSSLGRWTSDGYDLRDSTDSQVYSGVEAEQPDCDRAVRETAGLILTVGGHPITAYFCADCGGVTAPGDTPDECPHSVSDADAHGATDKDKPLPPTWSLTVTPEKLRKLLASSAPTGMTPMQIAIAETDASGRARRLRMTWVPVRSVSKGDKKLEGSETPGDVGPAQEADAPLESRKREKSGKQGKPGREKDLKESKEAKEERLPPGATTRDLSTVTLRSLLGAQTMRSTLFTVHKNADGAFVFEGRGWGHGRGLCQVGAIALAAPPRGFDFRAILHRYYAGATLAPLRSSEENEEGVPDAAPTAQPAPAQRRRLP